MREVIRSAYLRFLYKGSITADISGKIRKKTKHGKRIWSRRFAKA